MDGTILRLNVADYRDATQWRWVLRNRRGSLLAEHQVDLNAGTGEYEGFVELHRYLRWRAAPDNRLPSEARILRTVGRWITEEVLGDVGWAIVNEAMAGPVTVRVHLPEPASVLLSRPLELGYVHEKPLALHDVSFVYEVGEPRRLGMSRSQKRPVGRRLRILAVFSLPVDAGALALRRERHQLTQMVRGPLQDKAIDLRVLQYGVTRDRLRMVLEEPVGWDIVHFSGHGLAGGFAIEHADGRRDLVSAQELVALLAPAGTRLKLVTLSSCDSAARVVDDELRALGITEPEGSVMGPAASADTDGELEQLPALAVEISRRLNCAVLAMRYPVSDEFASSLTSGFYRLLFDEAVPAPTALQRALHNSLPASPTPGSPPISVAIPVLLGPRAADLRIVPPRTGHAEPAPRHEQPVLPREPDRFVGRVKPIMRAAEALAPQSTSTALLFHGMAGAGKTACALELVHGLANQFERVLWYQAPREGTDALTSLAQFVVLLEGLLDQVKLRHVVSDEERLRRAMPGLSHAFGDSGTLLILDNMETLLKSDGGWRDERWRMLVCSLIDHQRSSRVVLTSRRPLDFRGSRVQIEPIHALPRDEAVLLARQLPNLRALMDGVPDMDQSVSRAIVARILTLVQGHPKLMELADSQAEDAVTLQRRLDDLERLWPASPSALAVFLQEGEATATEEEFVLVLQGWAQECLQSLPEDAVVLFQFLCAIEDDDWDKGIVEAVWPAFRHGTGRPESHTVGEALVSLVTAGLVEVEVAEDTKGRSRRFRIHPEVATVGRTMMDSEAQEVSDRAMIRFWVQQLREGWEGPNATAPFELILRVTPYLVRQREWGLARMFLGQALLAHESRATMADLTGLLRQAVDDTRGTAYEQEYAYIAARLGVDDADVGENLQTILRQMVERGDYDGASAAAETLIRTLVDSGRLDEALGLAEEMARYTRQAGCGHWTQLYDEGMRLWIRALQGHGEEVLATVQRLMREMGDLPEPGTVAAGVTHIWRELTTPALAREQVLNAGAVAAAHLARWERALELSQTLTDSRIRRRASQTDIASGLEIVAAALFELDRIAEARDLLLKCRRIYEAGQDDDLGRVLSHLAVLEETVGHVPQATEIGRDALRVLYSGQDVTAIANAHSDLGYFLARAGDRGLREAFAHAAAASMITLRTSGYQLDVRLARLASTTIQGQLSLAPNDLFPGHQDDDFIRFPTSFDEVCGVLDQLDGVWFRDLFTRLPGPPREGSEAFAEILRRAEDIPGHQLRAPDGLWASGTAAAACGSPRARAAMGRLLSSSIPEPPGPSLWSSLSRIIAGERGNGLLVGLDPFARRLVERALEMTEVLENLPQLVATGPYPPPRSPWSRWARKLRRSSRWLR